MVLPGAAAAFLIASATAPAAAAAGTPPLAPAAAEPDEPELDALDPAEPGAAVLDALSDPAVPAGPVDPVDPVDPDGPVEAGWLEGGEDCVDVDCVDWPVFPDGPCCPPPLWLLPRPPELELLEPPL